MIAILEPVDLTSDQMGALRTRAASQPQLLRVWVIGSRAEGRARTDSDLDLTVELLPGPGDSGELAALIPIRQRWCRDLTALMRVLVKDIQLEKDPRDPCFGRGRSGGFLIYEASAE